MPIGRPRIYDHTYITRTEEYLVSCGNSYRYIPVQPLAPGSTVPQTYKTVLDVKLPSIEGLALHLGVHRDTIYQWESEKDADGKLLYPDFSDIIDNLRKKQAEMLINNGVAGTYNPIISKVLMTKHGYREGVDQTTNDKDLPIPILNALPNHNSDKEDSEAPQTH